jgi:hypothetical protein
VRYSKWSLLIFGAGMVLGLAVVAARLSGLARVASLAMAAGIGLLPFALFADWRRALRRPGKRRKKPAATKRRAAPARRRTRKPTKKRP